MRKIVSSESRWRLPSEAWPRTLLCTSSPRRATSKSAHGSRPGVDVALGEEAVDAGEALGIEAERAGRGDGERRRHGAILAARADHLHARERSGPAHSGSGAVASAQIVGSRLEASGANGSESRIDATLPKHTRDRESERILAGIGLVILAVACFATLDTATKVSTSVCRS